MNTVRNAETRAQEVLDRLNTAILMCDTSLNIIMMNPASEDMFGVSANKALAQPLSALLPADAEAIALTARRALSARQAVTAHDVTLRVAEKRQIQVDYTVTPLGDHDEDGLLFELLRIDGYLNIARDHHRADQYAAHREVLRGLAHEVKNPLGGLRGAAQLLERELSDRDARQYTHIIIHEADRLRNLVDRVMGSHQPVQFRATNIHEVLEHVRKLILVEVQEGISIERDYDPSLPSMHGDPDQLIQAVLNIARNAVDALNRSGLIRFRTRVERSINVGGQWHRSVIRVDIIDNGPGIPESMRERVFYPMVTGHADGTGLGLSIAQDIVHKHRGSIQLHCEPGSTRFSLMLPFENKETDTDGA